MSACESKMLFRVKTLKLNSFLKHQYCPVRQYWVSTLTLALRVAKHEKIIIIQYYYCVFTGAAEPSVTNLDQTNDWALLKCVVKGASPKPTVEWWDSNNQTIPSEEPQVSKKGERFFITLKTNVTKTDRYHCVATQKEIWHQAHTEINVHLNGE